ncbi:MAG: site-specific integrase [Ruminococcaceae bacterium]|nr:site-specific integrase [Oscillospiraceae bacterium]
MATKVSKGRYKSTVFLGTVDGKRKYKVFYAETASEADFLALEYKLKKEERSDPGRITVGEAVNDYIDSKSNILSPSTITGYKVKRRNNFQSLMDVRVADVTTQMLQKAINAESARYSAKTVKCAYNVIVLGIGIYRPEFNPKVTLPKEKPLQYATPDGETLKRIFEASKGTRLEIPVLLAAWLSLRASEVIGLRWTDVYDDHIHVRTARVYSEQGTVEKETKTASSNRRIPLPAYIKKVLDEAPHDSEFVCNMTGAALYKAFIRMLEQNDIPHCRFHDLRHANASVMVMLGVPDRYAQARGGWATGTVLTKRYQQTFSDEEIRIAERIDTYFDSLMHTKIHTENPETPANKG